MPEQVVIRDGKWVWHSWVAICYGSDCGSLHQHGPHGMGRFLDFSIGALGTVPGAYGF